jgi:hypothetical protein
LECSKTDLVKTTTTTTTSTITITGVAGGSKYICSNIFFKFALDTDLRAPIREKRGLTGIYIFAFCIQIPNYSIYKLKYYFSQKSMNQLSRRGITTSLDVWWNRW